MQNHRQCAVLLLPLEGEAGWGCTALSHGSPPTPGPSPLGRGVSGKGISI